MNNFLQRATFGIDLTGLIKTVYGMDTAVEHIAYEGNIIGLEAVIRTIRGMDAAVEPTRMS